MDNLKVWGQSPSPHAGRGADVGFLEAPLPTAGKGAGYSFASMSGVSNGETPFSDFISLGLFAVFCNISLRRLLMRQRARTPSGRNTWQYQRHSGWMSKGRDDFLSCANWCQSRRRRALSPKNSGIGGENRNTK